MHTAKKPAAYCWLICWEDAQTGERFRNTRAGEVNQTAQNLGKQHRKERVYWSSELAESNPALLAYEAELSKFVASASERIIYRTRN